MSGCLDFYAQITILWKKCVLCKKCSRIAAEFHCFLKRTFSAFEVDLGDFKSSP